MRANRTAALAAVLLGIAGCSDTLVAPSDSNDTRLRITPRYELEAAANGRIERGTEDDILRMENFLPGLGGIYTDGGDVVVYAPPTVSRESVLAALARGAVTLALDPKERGQIVRGERIRILPSRFAFSQLVAWMESGVAASVKGVSTLDADEKANRLSIRITDETAREKVITEANLAGVPVEALNITLAPHEYADGGLDGTFRPVVGGVQVTNDASPSEICTVGYNHSNGPEEEGFYTASHCNSASLGSGSTNQLFYQPTKSIANIVGRVAANPAWNLTDAACGGFTRCGRVDAMWIRYDTTSLSAHWIATPDWLSAYPPLSWAWPPPWWKTAYWTTITGSTTHWVGMDVDKVGRTTGWTRGQYNGSCVSATPDSGVTSKEYRILCADEVTGGMAGHGDSGAPVFIAHDDSNTELFLLGIEFASAGATLDEDENHNSFCTSGCIYHYSTITRIGLYVPLPPA